MDIINLTVLLLACVLSVEPCKIIQCVMDVFMRMKFEDVDPTLCTHIRFSYGPKSTEKLVYPNNANGKEIMPFLVRLNALKKKNSGLKIVIAIKPDVKDDFFYIMYRDSKMRSQFIQETINYLRSANCDGVVFITDIQTYLRKVGTNKPSYVALLQEMSLAFSKESSTARKPALSLSVSILADTESIEQDLDITGIAKYVDFIYVHTSFNQGRDPYILQHISPLYGEDESDTKSLDYYARYLTAKGIESQKLIFGFPVSAYYFIYGWRGTGYGYRYFRHADYKMVCADLKNNVPLFDEFGMVPYYMNKDAALLYNDQNSLRIKVIYIKSHGYGGVYVYQLNYDDMEGVCNQGKFPLLTAISNECRGIS